MTDGVAAGRTIGAVIAGYLLFAIPAFVFFQITGQTPHHRRRGAG